VCDSGGTRRSWLRGIENVSKRYLIAVAAHRLGRILRMLFGIGKPKTLQGLLALTALVQLLSRLLWLAANQSAQPYRPISQALNNLGQPPNIRQNTVRSTGS
jgi:transposase